MLILVSRAVVVGVLYPFLRYFGYGLDLKEAFILVWGGLRGAVALSLSLSVKVTMCGCLISPSPLIHSAKNSYLSVPLFMTLFLPGCFQRSSDGSQYISSDTGTLVSRRKEVLVGNATSLKFSILNYLLAVPF